MDMWQQVGQRSSPYGAGKFCLIHMNLFLDRVSRGSIDILLSIENSFHLLVPWLGSIGLQTYGARQPLQHRRCSPVVYDV